MSVGIEVVLIISQKAPFRQHGPSQAGVWECSSTGSTPEAQPEASTRMGCVPRGRAAQITLVAHAKFNLCCKKEECTDASQQPAVRIEALDPLSQQKVSPT